MNVPPSGELPILETVRWRNGAVRILDQTLLPASEVYLELRSVDEVIGSVQRLAVRGAPAIGVTGALGLALAARNLVHTHPTREGTWSLAALRPDAERLAAARPTAVNLRWAIDRVWRCLEAAAPSVTSERLSEIALAEAEQILEEDLELSRAMARHGRDLIPNDARVLTHCNTGGLATAGGGTALGAVLLAHTSGKRVFVHVDETRPLLQGARLTAWELARAGVPHVVQVDGAAAWTMRSHRVDGVFVGADRIARNGDTANKIGTLSVALAARAYDVPFYVVAPRSSFDSRCPTGEEIPIEERSREEVAGFLDRIATPASSATWNPAFDVTPAALIAGWVTERGVERPPFNGG